MGNRHNQRVRGYTIAETVIALAILGLVITGIGQFAVYINTGIDDLRLTKQIRWEIENARELIGSWPLDRVTTENIDQLPISSQLSEKLKDVQWKSSIMPTTISLSQNSPSPTDKNAEAASMSVPAKAVTLQLNAQYRGQMISPVELTFWVIAPTNRVADSQAAENRANQSTDSQSNQSADSQVDTIEAKPDAPNSKDGDSKDGESKEASVL